METMDKTKPVMVTGATGYVAGWLMKKLLDEGHTVHAAVREPNNKKKTAHLDELAQKAPGQIRYFKADLLEEGSYAEAMEGCGLVYHTACPFTTDVKDPQKQLIDPALKGTQNVLHQANATESVKRVVVTSSCAAIYTDASDIKDTPDNILTEDVWNTTASLNYQPYSYSKTLAELEAWKIAEAQDRWHLVTVNPSFVLGPALNPQSATSESFNILRQMGDGTFKTGVPNMAIGVVDVRDLAEAHYQAGMKPDASGRHIISAHNSSLLEVAKVLHKQYGDRYPIPNKALPKWLLLLIGPLVNKAITRKFVRNNINLEWRADNTKSKEQLGISYRPLEETMKDSFAVLIEQGIAKPK